MTMFSEDPTFPVAALILAAIGCFVALKSRQEGKYLLWGLGVLGLAGLVAAAEWFWVTDNERIESVVYDMRKALLASDSERLLSHLTPDVQYVQAGETLPTLATRTIIQTSLANSTFDVVRLHELQTSAGKQTRRGKAEFKVFVRGNVQGPFGMGGSGAADTTWSLGFEETKPGVWKVNRITPISLPYNPALLAGVERAAGREPGRLMHDPSLMHFPNEDLHNRRLHRDRIDRKTLSRNRGLRPGP